MHLTTCPFLTFSVCQHSLAEPHMPGPVVCKFQFYFVFKDTGAALHATHISSPSVLLLHTPDICIVQRQRSYEEEVGSALNLRLNHIKTALFNFLNDLTRAVLAETDRALCPKTEPCPLNGRESKHFISPHALLALYCLSNIITAFRNSPFACGSHLIFGQLLRGHDKKRLILI